LYLTLALAATLIVLLFARDVTRSAHGAIGPRRSENRSFGSLANGLIAQQNDLDAHLAYLLAHGQSLSRPVFAARLEQLNQMLPVWTTEAGLLRRPKLAHNVNEAVAQLTEQRVDAYRSLLAVVARRLNLPWPAIPATSQAVTDPARALITSSAQWGIDRWSLVKEPGLVHLHALTTATATYFANVGTAGLVASPTLALTRGIGIAAVAVKPSPLPAAAGVLLLPPVTSVHLGVSVVNIAYAIQPVTLRVTFTSSVGPVQHQVLSVTLGPLQSYAFVPRLLTTRPSERGTLVISLTGAAAAPNMARSRTYQVKMSPSGNG
jgi:hypothetical protein